MADSNTTTYSFTLPEVGASADSWGTKLNANWDKVDDLLDGSIAVNGITVTGGSIDGTPVGATTPSTGAFTTVTTTGNVDVTGTVTADGLTVDGNSYVGAGNYFTDTTSGYFFGGNGSYDAGVFATGTSLTTLKAQNNIAFTTASSEKMRIDSSGRVGIGLTDPWSMIHVKTASRPYARFEDTDGTTQYIDVGTDSGNHFLFGYGSYPLLLGTNGTERARIDSSGNLLVGKTSLNSAVDGIELRAGGRLGATFDGGNPAFFNRRSSDGEIIRLLQDDAIVGTVGSNSTGDLYIAGNNGSTYLGNSATSFQVLDSLGSGTPRIRPTTDNVANLGDSGLRFKDLYLSGGVYLGGTGAANKLDDYETGTFDPIVKGSSVAGTPTYNTRTGSYIKVGRAVHFRLYLIWTNITGYSGYMLLGGLPFPVAAGVDARYSAITIGYANGIAWGTGVPSLHTKPASTDIYIGSSASGGAWINSSMDTSGDIILSGTYYTDV